LRWPGIVDKSDNCFSRTPEEGWIAAGWGKEAGMAEGGERLEGRTLSSLGRYLGRRIWVPVVLALVGAGLGVAAAAREHPRYSASSVLVGSSSTVPVTGFSQVAQALFQTNTVLQPVTSQFHLKQTPTQVVGSGTLDAIGLPDSYSVQILARSGDARTAATLANAAAQSFKRATQRLNVGTFKVVSAVVPTHPSARPFVLLAMVGGILGALLGLLGLVAWFLFRRPIVQGEDARDEFPNAMLVPVTVRRRLDWREAVPRRWRPQPKSPPRSEIRPTGLAPAVWRILDRPEAQNGRRVCLVVRVGKLRAGRAAEAVAEELQAHRRRTRRTRTTLVKSVRAHDSGLNVQLDRADGVVVVVPVGTPRRDLAELGDEIRLDGRGNKEMVLLLLNSR
jgi:hypothetical protein